MRTIKFRGWVKPDKDGNGGEMISQDVPTDFDMICNGDEFGVVENTENWLDKDRFIIMQFTGLKDKNGKDIYEGDIIKIQTNLNSAGYMGTNPKHYSYSTEVVEFYNGKFVSYNPNDNPNQPIKNVSPQSLRDFMDECYENEIIGNIHETPELL